MPNLGRHGFSVIETLLALVAGIVSAIVFGKVVGMQNQIQLFSKDKAAVATAHQELYYLIANHSSCTNVLAGINVGSLIAGTTPVNLKATSMAPAMPSLSMMELTTLQFDRVIKEMPPIPEGRHFDLNLYLVITNNRTGEVAKKNFSVSAIVDRATMKIKKCYREAGNAVILPGSVVMANLKVATSKLPPGWQLCDGTNGTPDLRKNIFIRGASNDGDISVPNPVVSGALIHTHSFIPASSKNDTKGGGGSATPAGHIHPDSVGPHLPPHVRLYYICRV
jgi:hypothetical protein